MLPTVLLSGITGLGKTVLLLAAGLFVAWAIVTAIFIPRRDQRFPRDLNVYITITAALFVVQMGAVWWVTDTQAVEAHAAEVSETGAGETETHGSQTTATETASSETETTETETTPAETETTDTETAPAETEQTETETETGGTAGNLAAGKEVFASAGCGACHALADAGSNGAVGPDLDESSPSEDKVVERVTEGQGAMPSFKDQLSPQQIADVAAYVSSVTDS